MSNISKSLVQKCEYFEVKESYANYKIILFEPVESWFRNYKKHVIKFKDYDHFYKGPFVRSTTASVSFRESIEFCKEHIGKQLNNQ